MRQQTAQNHPDVCRTTYNQMLLEIEGLIERVFRDVRNIDQLSRLKQVLDDLRVRMDELGRELNSLETEEFESKCWRVKDALCYEIEQHHQGG